MKKLLALVLALVMTLGLATVGTSAATYSDDADITHDEAVAVMSAIGVLAGDNGKFNPTGTLTREQGAKIITYMLMGGKEAGDALTAPSAPFADVAADRWSAGSIAYCKNAGIIAGVGNNNFDPTGTLTSYQFAKMLLVALGYDAEIEKMVGNDWAFSVAKLVTNTGLADGITAFKGNDGVSRDNAAQLAFNTLTSTMVYYGSEQSVGTNGSSINTNLQTSNVANSATTYETDGAGVKYGLSTGTASTQGDPLNTMQLCEKYFPDLKLNINVTDDMGRLAQTWKLKGDSVITQADEPYATTVAKLSSDADPKVSKVIDTVSESLDDSNITAANIYVNGVANTGVTLDTQIPAGSDVVLYRSSTTGKLTRVCITEYTVVTIPSAPATKVDSGVDKVTVPGVYTDYIKTSKVTGYEGLAKNDVVLYYKDADGNYFIEKAESVSGKVTGYNATTGVKVDGTSYPTSTISGNNGAYGGWATDFTNTYTFYLDHAKRVVKAVQDTTEAATANNYVILTKAAWHTGNGVTDSSYVELEVVKSDASKAVVKLASVDGVKAVKAPAVVENGLGYYDSSAKTSSGGNTASITKTYFYTVSGTSVTAKYYAAANNTDLLANSGLNVLTNSTTGSATGTNAYLVLNRIYAYTLNSDGEYKLSTVANGTDTWGNTDDQITKNVAKLNTTLMANTNTIFVYGVPDGDSVKYTQYSGIANAPTVADGFVTAVANNAVVNNNGFAKFVFIKVTDDTKISGTTDKDIVYLTTDASVGEEDNKTYYEYTGIIDGEKVTFRGAAGTYAKKALYYVASEDKDGVKTLTAVGTATGEISNLYTGVAANSASSIVLYDVANTRYDSYTYDNNTKVWYFDGTDVTERTADSIALDSTDLVAVVTVDKAKSSLAKEIYVVAKGAATPYTVTLTASSGSLSNSGNLVATGTTNTVAWTSASAADTIYVSALATSAAYTAGNTLTWSISGAGTAVSNATATGGTPSYAIVSGDIGKTLTLTISITDNFSNITTTTNYSIAVS